MAPVNRSPSANHPAKRCPRKLTVRRQMMVLGFMNEFRANPQQYSRYGTDEWMSSLVEYMCESPRYGLSTEDIKHWLDTNGFFNQVNAEYGYTSLKRRGRNASNSSGGSGGLVPVLEEQPNGVDSEDDTMPLGDTVEMEVDHEVSDVSDEVALDLRIKIKADEDGLEWLIETTDDEEALDLRIKTDVDQDALEERRPSIGAAQYDYGSLQAEPEDVQPESDETDEGGSVLDDLLNGADDATMSLLHAVEMKVDHEAPGHSDEVAVNMMNIKTEADEDSLGEGRHSSEFGPAQNDASFDAVAAAASQPCFEEIEQEAEYPGLVEAVQGAMVQYSQEILGCYPAGLSSQTPVSSVPEGIRQLQEYAAKMNDIVVDLGYDETTIINVGGWCRPNNLLRMLLSEVENDYVDPFITVEL